MLFPLPGNVLSLKSAKPYFCKEMFVFRQFFSPATISSFVFSPLLFLCSLIRRSWRHRSPCDAINHCDNLASQPGAEDSRRLEREGLNVSSLRCASLCFICILSHFVEAFLSSLLLKSDLFYSYKKCNLNVLLKIILIDIFSDHAQ